MSDQTAPTTGATDANNPDGTGTQEEQDFRALYESEKQRADNLQPEFTRATQELAQQRQLVEALQSDDPGQQAWAASVLGLEFVEPEQEEVEPDDELGTLKQRLEAQEAWRAQQEQTQSQRDQAAQDDQFKTSVVADLAREDYPESLRGLVADVALILAGEIGRVDLDAAKNKVAEMAEAWADHPNVQTAVKKRWQNTKPTAAVTQPGGVQATHTQPLDTREKKADFISQLYASAEADEQGP